MAMVERFEDLDVWKRARELANLIYDVTELAPLSRDYGFRDQIRRASVSILSNIAEGFESKTQSLFIDYLSRAKGSAGELRAQLYLALDREYINQPDFDKLATQAEICSRQLASFIRYLETRPNARRVINEDQAAYDI